MKRSSFDEMHCSVAQTLNIVGEWWSWLIIRDIRLGINRFNLIQENLGISKKVLSDRVKTLVSYEIIEAVSKEDIRQGYKLTDKGEELMPITRTMMAWGDKWIYKGNGPVKIRHLSCNKIAKVKLMCDQCGGEITSENSVAEPDDIIQAKLDALATSPKETI